MVQLGTDANEAKVFRAHAAPLGLCDNLISALLQLVLRSSIEMDKHSALDVVICAKVSGLSRSRGQNSVKITQKC